MVLYIQVKSDDRNQYEIGDDMTITYFKEAATQLK